VIRVGYSDINYKDALAATGPARSCAATRWSAHRSGGRRGKLERYTLPARRCGARDRLRAVRNHDGGYAQFARVPGDWVIPIPQGLDAFTAMALGTAGFTAALAIHRLEQNGQSRLAGRSRSPAPPEAWAHRGRHARCARLPGRGGERKAGAAQYLKELGAAEVLARQDLELGSRPWRLPASPAPSTIWEAKCSPGSRAA